MSMNHFSIKVSQALRDIGVESDTTYHWGKSAYDGEYVCTNKAERKLRKINEFHDEPGAGDVYDLIPAYTLADILRLMPQIGEKMGWGTSIHELQNGTGLRANCRHLLDAFLEGDYEGAEVYLLSLLTKPS